MNYEEFKDLICKKYNATCAVILKTITTESEEKYCESEDSESQITTQRVIRLIGSPEFRIDYYDEHEKYFLYRLDYGKEDAYLCADRNPENILKVIESIINCGN